MKTMRLSGGGYVPPPAPEGGGAPAWVPAGAKIHIDLVGGTPQGRAFVAGTGEVAVDTLLGNDPNTEGGWDTSGYDAGNLTADGYVASDAVLALIGSARAMVLAGATMRAQWRMLSTSVDLKIAVVSADGDDAVECDIQKDQGRRVIVYSWSGDMSIETGGVMNVGVGTTNVVAITLTDVRAEVSVNGVAAMAGLMVDDDRPVANPLVAVVIDGSYPAATALQSITLYDPLSSTSGLSALSEAGLPNTGPSEIGYAWDEGTVYNVAGSAAEMSQNTSVGFDIQLVIDIAVSDAEGNPIAFGLNSSDPSLRFVDNGPTDRKIVVLAGEVLNVGAQTFTLRATDIGGLYSEQTFTLAVV